MDKNQRFYSANSYFKEIFGEKVYKLSLDGGMTCPNRDGTLGNSGCIFCSNGGSGDFAEKTCEDINIQINSAKAQVKNKYKGNKFIAYFQSFSNTYAPTDYLKKLFFSAIENKDIVALSIGTRPDCLGDDVLNLLDELNTIKPVFIELGLQTIHEKTAIYIRRGYPLSCFDKALKELKNRNINVIVHTILGLPFETHSMMIETIKYIGKSGADGIKLQLLHILKNTDLEYEYKSGVFQALTLSEYIDILCECIEELSSKMVIHRITGDAPKNSLIAPIWSADKKNVLNTINKELEKRNIRQGAKFIK